MFSFCPRRLQVVALALLVPLGVMVGSAQAQTGSVSGQITDLNTRQPLSSVQIFIADLDLGGLSQANGRYALVNVPAGTHTVTADRIGFRSVTQEIVVGAGQTAVLNFELSAVALALDEIIVTGTAGGTQRRAVGNAVTRLQVDPALRIAPVSSLQAAIGANVPGLTFFTAGSAPGHAGADIRIRGSSSQALTNAPIVYIDGIRMDAGSPQQERVGQGRTLRSRLDDINPEDIERIEVIKGPAAATLYGTEASNGVIQIITKRGESGAPVFDVSVGGGVRWMHNPSKVYGLRYGTNVLTGALLEANPYDTEEARLGFPLYEMGNQQDYDLSVRGGTDIVRYFASGSYGRAQGIRDYNVDKRTSMRTSISIIPSENLDIRTSLAYNIQETRLMSSEHFQLYVWKPANSEFAGGLVNPKLGFFRPPEEERTAFYTVDRDRTNLSVEINYRPLTWLSNRLVFGRDLQFERTGNLIPRQPLGTKDPFWTRRGDGVRLIGTRRVTLSTFDYNGTISRPLTDNISSATSFGAQYYSNVNTFHSSQGDDFATAGLTTVSGGAENLGTEDFVENTTLGFFFQEQLDWNGRFFLTGAVRRDDNSAFGSDFSGATYPKASATWVMSEEGFWNVDFVETLRLRGAWGQAGQQPDAIAAAQLFTPETGENFVPILTPASLGNPELGPEKGQELEVGFDAMLFDGRVNVEFTGWWRDTKDAIVTQQISPSLGIAGSQLVNIGLIRSWGTETAISLAVLTENPVRWDIQASFASQNNEIEKLGGAQVALPVRKGRLHVEGFPLASIFSHEILSAEFIPGTTTVNKDTWMCDGGTGKGGREIGGSAVNCTGSPLLFKGRAEPAYIVMFNSTWTLWDDFQLFASVDGLLDYWTLEDGCTGLHDSLKNSLASRDRDDPFFVAHLALRREGLCEVKNGFLKLRELGGRYSFPASLAQRIGASRASFSVGARNLKTLYRAQEISDFGVRIADPEGYLNTEEFGGETRYVLPPQVQINAVLRLSF